MLENRLLFISIVTLNILIFKVFDIKARDRYRSFLELLCNTSDLAEPNTSFIRFVEAEFLVFLVLFATTLSVNFYKIFYRKRNRDSAGSSVDSVLSRGRKALEELPVENFGFYTSCTTKNESSTSVFRYVTCSCNFIFRIWQ